MSFILTNRTQSVIPDIFWPAIKNKVIGEKYNVSLVFVGDNAIKKLSRRYLKKNKVTNILAFPLRKDEGEIYLCPAYIKKEAKRLDIDFKSYIIKLFIHGLLHLKGYEHGEEMEEKEEKYIN